MNANKNYEGTMGTGGMDSTIDAFDPVALRKKISNNQDGDNHHHQSTNDDHNLSNYIPSYNAQSAHQRVDHDMSGTVMYDQLDSTLPSVVNKSKASTAKSSMGPMDFDK